jgi:hypothetical protein
MGAAATATAIELHKITPLSSFHMGEPPFGSISGTDEL